MTVGEAHQVLMRRTVGDEDPDIVDELRARATLWRNGTSPEHADYCDRAADEIERLRVQITLPCPPEQP